MDSFGFEAHVAPGKIIGDSLNQQSFQNSGNPLRLEVPEEMRLIKMCIVVSIFFICLEAPAGPDDHLVYFSQARIQTELIEMAGSFASELTPDVRTAVEGLAQAYFEVARAPKNTYWQKVLILNLALTVYLVDHSQKDAPTTESFLSTLLRWSVNVLPNTTRDIAAPLVNRDLAFLYLQEINRELKLIGDGSPAPEQIIQYHQTFRAESIKVGIASILGVSLVGVGSQLLGDGGELTRSSVVAVGSGFAMLALALRYWLKVEMMAEPNASIDVVGRYFSRIAEAPCEILLRAPHIRTEVPI